MNLDPQVIQAAAAMELKRRAEQERLRYYQRPLVHFKQRSVNRCNKRFRGVLGGNRAGKTVVGSVETVLFTLGRLAEPYVQDWHDEDKEWWYERFGSMNVTQREQVWVATVNWDVHRDVTQDVLIQWLPQKEIVDIAWRRKGVIDYIVTTGRRIVFKSYETGADGFQGASLPFVWLDEEPPFEIWNECEKRVMDRKGSILLTFTPLHGITWSHGRIYLNDLNDPETWATNISWDDNPYLDPQEKQRLLSQMTPEEIEARVHGRYLVLGGMVFDTNILLEHRKGLSQGTPTRVPDRFMVRKDLSDRIFVWEEPTPRERYVIGLDSAEGLPSGDNHALCVIRVRDGMQVAEYATNRIDTVQFTDLAMSVGRWYNNALIQPERNNDGKVVISRLVESGYPTIYRHYEDDRWGFPTKASNRLELIGLGQEYVRETVHTIRSPLLVEEMMTFVRNARGRPEASGKGRRGGKKDDRIFAWLHSLWGREWFGEVGPPTRPRTPLPHRADSLEAWAAGYDDESKRGNYAKWKPDTFTRWPSQD